MAGDDEEVEALLKEAAARAKKGQQAYKRAKDAFRSARKKMRKKNFDSGVAAKELRDAKVLELERAAKRLGDVVKQILKKLPG